MTVEEKTAEIDVQIPKTWYGTRHTQALLYFVLLVIAYGMRVNLSVGIVAMTDPSVNKNFPTYNWTDKSIILSSFFWGYIIPQVGAGQLAKNYGPKWFLIVTMAVGSFCTISIPFMAKFGSWALIACRVVQGLTQGFIFPSLHNLLSKWSPVRERTRLGAFVYSGSSFGTVAAMLATGWICGTSFGWPSIFYIYGFFGFAWIIAFAIWGSNGPSAHKSISEEEKLYIQANLTPIVRPPPTPWKQIFSSKPLWAIIVAHCGNNWGFTTLLTQIPTYMAALLNFNITDNGLLSALPYFVFWILSFVFGASFDLVINRKYLSVGNARKLANSLGFVIPALALTILSFVDADRNLVVALLILAVGSNAGINCGFTINHIDISPRHAGTLMGITNGLGTICSVLAPLTIQFIVTDYQSLEQWRYVFLLSAGFYVLPAIFFAIFGSGKVQSWDSESSQKLCENKSDIKQIPA